MKQRRPALPAAATGRDLRQQCCASSGMVHHARAKRVLQAVAVASPRAQFSCGARSLHASVPTKLSSNSSSTASESAAAINPVTATHSVDGAANHQPFTQQQLLDLGAKFVGSWFAGIAKGPQAVEESLSGILDSNVLLVADRVRQLQDQAGLTEVLAELERAHLEYHRSEHRPMLYAASEQSQCVYALVEGRYQDVGALPGHPATFRVSKVHHILALQVGTAGRVQRLWLRRQMTEEDKDELLHDPLACYASPFPRDGLRLADANGGVMLKQQPPEGGYQAPAGCQPIRPCCAAAPYSCTPASLDNMLSPPCHQLSPGHVMAQLPPLLLAVGIHDGVQGTLASICVTALPPRMGLPCTAAGTLLVAPAIPGARLLPWQSPGAVCWRSCHEPVVQLQLCRCCQQPAAQGQVQHYLPILTESAKSGSHKQRAACWLCNERSSG
ncbi:hypothetical protein COO60DRAFT_1456763 [Scenedesmus sp. NREL 46B-D3]|nr:hypothetical protein COO60DRAFT_1456763 [Scenedesmus sp. NREL 46B-D3]